METSSTTAILITKEDFNRAIRMNMDAQLRNPQFKGHTEAAMVYAMSGAVFTREVMNILFGEEKDHE